MSYIWYISVLIMPQKPSVDPLSTQRPILDIDCFISWFSNFFLNVPLVYWNPRSLLSRIRDNSDRGFQYTNCAFHAKLEAAGMTQSMSRVAKCIDNGPMEGFWGIIKRECYYGEKFTSRESMVEMIENYMEYYNNRRLQRNLGVLTPMEKHEIYI